MIINGRAVCNWFDYRPDQPCWGEILYLMDCGDEGTMHCCEGHEGMWDGDGYKPQNEKGRPVSGAA